ncbi:hypothetical protein KY290_010978 [Solanum tuberosum]|uniref:DUF4283 domain-containing protein n=1 Tax=Solanum tuberosum TaxID=4113 RepID=A0ABQ7VZC8_SOLTU|nr:hypothetical protein KY290_010978 [Solanum tuberosum]
MEMYAPKIGHFINVSKILSLVHRWVKFPELPEGYWPVKALSKISSVVGHPMHTDHFTTNTDKVSFNRILIKVDVSQPSTELINIETPSDCGYRNRPRKVVLLRLLAPRTEANVPRTKKRKTRKAQPPKMVWHVVVRRGNHPPDGVGAQHQQCSHVGERLFMEHPEFRSLLQHVWATADHEQATEIV